MDESKCAFRILFPDCTSHVVVAPLPKVGHIFELGELDDSPMTHDWRVTEVRQQCMETWVFVEKS